MLLEPDTFQRSVHSLAKSLVRNDNVAFYLPSPRSQISPRPPGTLSQRLKSDTVAQIVERYETGEPSTTLAAAYGISKGSVIKLLREAGVKIRNQGLTDDQSSHALSRRVVAGQYRRTPGVDHGTVSRQLRKRGVKMRDTHGPPAISAKVSGNARPMVTSALANVAGARLVSFGGGHDGLGAFVGVGDGAQAAETTRIFSGRTDRSHLYTDTFARRSHGN